MTSERGPDRAAPWGDISQHIIPHPAYVTDPEYLRAWLGAERLGITPLQARLLFAGDSSEDDLAAFRLEPVIYDDNELLPALLTFHLCGPAPLAHPVLAHFLSEWWTGGHGYRLYWLKELHDIEPDALLEIMWPFRGTSVLMGDESLRRFSELPEVFTVWRGGAGPKERVAAGYCWTTDRSTAEFFAERNKDFGPPTVVSRRIARRNVVAAHFDRESEIIVRPSRGAWRRYWAWETAKESP